MSTIIGFECDDGAVIAGDRTQVRGGSIVSRSRDRVFTFDSCGTAVIGDDPDEFRRELDIELRTYRQEQGEPDVDAVARMVSTVAESVGVDVILTAWDDDGEACLRRVSRDGSTLADPYAAYGSGAALALGQLEGADRGVGLDEAEELAQDVLETVAERDSATGDDIDVWGLADEV